MQKNTIYYKNWTILNETLVHCWNYWFNRKLKDFSRMRVFYWILALQNRKFNSSRNLSLTGILRCRRDTLYGDARRLPSSRHCEIPVDENRSSPSSRRVNGVVTMANLLLRKWDTRRRLNTTERFSPVCGIAIAVGRSTRIRRDFNFGSNRKSRCRSSDLAFKITAQVAVQLRL